MSSKPATTYLRMGTLIPPVMTTYLPRTPTVHGFTEISRSKLFSRFPTLLTRQKELCTWKLKVPGRALVLVGLASTHLVLQKRQPDLLYNLKAAYGEVSYFFHFYDGVHAIEREALRNFWYFSGGFPLLTQPKFCFAICVRHSVMRGYF